MKRGDPWYKRNPRDIYDGTRQLSLEARGAYNDILDLIYMHAGPIPDDTDWMAHALHTSKRKWTSLRKKLIDAGKITIEGDTITNARAVFELETRRIQSETNREIAVKRERNSRENRGNTNNINGPPARTVHHARAIDTDTDLDRETPTTSLEPDAARSGAFKNGNCAGSERHPAVLPKFVSEAALVQARRKYPGWDMQSFLAEFNPAGMDASARDPDAAFIGFVKKRTKGRSPLGDPLPDEAPASGNGGWL